MLATSSNLEDQKYYPSTPLHSKYTFNINSLSSPSSNNNSNLPTSTQDVIEYYTPNSQDNEENEMYCQELNWQEASITPLNSTNTASPPSIEPDISQIRTASTYNLLTSPASPIDIPLSAYPTSSSPLSSEPTSEFAYLRSSLEIAAANLNSHDFPPMVTSLRIPQISTHPSLLVRGETTPSQTSPDQSPEKASAVPTENSKAIPSYPTEQVLYYSTNEDVR